MGWGYPVDLGDFLKRARTRPELAAVLKHVDSLQREDEKLSALAWEVSRGWFPMLSDRKTTHLGVDLGLPGDSFLWSPVLAIGDGDVVYADTVIQRVDKCDFGRVIVRHPTPKGDAYALYMQLGSIGTYEGAEVSQGDPLGTVGWYRNFHHLHFAVVSREPLGGNADVQLEVDEGRWPAGEDLWNILRVKCDLDPNEWVGFPVKGPWYAIQPIEFVRAMRGEEYRHYNGAGSPRLFVAEPAVASSAAKQGDKATHTADGVLNYEPFKSNPRLQKLAHGDGVALKKGNGDRKSNEALQQALTVCGLLSLPSKFKGVFGGLTETALKVFQEGSEDTPGARFEIDLLAKHFGRSPRDVVKGVLDRFTLLALDAAASAHESAKDATRDAAPPPGPAAPPPEPAAGPPDEPPPPKQQGEWVFETRGGKKAPSLGFGLKLYDALLRWELDESHGPAVKDSGKPPTEAACLYSCLASSVKPYPDVYQTWFKEEIEEIKKKNEEIKKAKGKQIPIPKFQEWPRLDRTHPGIPPDMHAGAKRMIKSNGAEYPLYTAGGVTWVTNGYANCCISQFAAFFAACGGKEVRIRNDTKEQVVWLRNEEPGHKDMLIGDTRASALFEKALMVTKTDLFEKHVGGGVAGMRVLGIGDAIPAPGYDGKFTENPEVFRHVRVGDWANSPHHSWLVGDVRYGIWTKDAPSKSPGKRREHKYPLSTRPDAPDLVVHQSSFVGDDFKTDGAEKRLTKAHLEWLAEPKNEKAFLDRVNAFLKDCLEKKSWGGKTVKHFDVVEFQVFSANGLYTTVHGQHYKKDGKLDNGTKKNKKGKDVPCSNEANHQARGITRMWSKELASSTPEKDEDGNATERESTGGLSFGRFFGPVTG